jgi:acetyl esterase/lipase
MRVGTCLASAVLPAAVMFVALGCGSATPASGACRSRTLPVPAGSMRREGRPLSGAPAYAELAEPASAPRGVMVLLHGGGWTDVGEGGVAAMRPEARHWRRRGWITVNATYRPCAASVGDAIAYYDLVARRWPGLPVCALGGSAGGHLALTIAARRPRLACAIAEGAPIDLDRLAGQTAYDPVTGARQRAGPRFVRELAVNAFGGANLTRFSVPAPAARPATRYVLAWAARDPYVPYEQAVDFAAAVRAAGGTATTLRLAPGDRPFTHAPVSAAALRALREEEDRVTSGAAR